MSSQTAIRSGVRLLLLFFIMGLWAFEWQAILARTDQLTGSVAGPRLSLLSSIGSMLLVALSLRYQRKFPATMPQLLGGLIALGLLNTIFAMMLGRGMDSTIRLAIYATVVMNAVVCQGAIGFETTRIVRSIGSLAFVRPFGSWGFLIAALVSQQSNGALLYIAICASICLFLLNQFSSDSTPIDISQSDGPRSIGISFGWIIVIAILLGFITRGFDSAVTLELREKNDRGLGWLSLMIICETVFLLCSKWLPSRPVISFASVAWLIAYGCFLIPEQNAILAIGMFFVGFNCTWQTKLASSLEAVESSNPVHRQVLISGAITIGGLIFAVLPAVLGIQTLHEIIRFAAFSSALSVVVVGAIMYLNASQK